MSALPIEYRAINPDVASRYGAKFSGYAVWWIGKHEDRCGKRVLSTLDEVKTFIRTSKRNRCGGSWLVEGHWV